MCWSIHGGKLDGLVHFRGVDKKDFSAEESWCCHCNFCTGTGVILSDEKKTYCSNLTVAIGQCRAPLPGEQRRSLCPLVCLQSSPFTTLKKKMESRNEADSRSDPTLPDVAPKPPTAEAGAKKSLKPCAQAARNPPPRLRASSRTSPARRDRCACPRPPACPARAKGSPARTPPSRAKHRRRVRWRPSAALPCIEPRTAVVDASPLRLRLRARARPRTCSRRRGPSLPGSGLGACSAPPPRSSHGNHSGSA